MGNFPVDDDRRDILFRNRGFFNPFSKIRAQVPFSGFPVVNGEGNFAKRRNEVHVFFSKEDAARIGASKHSGIGDDIRMENDRDKVLPAVSVDIEIDFHDVSWKHGLSRCAFANADRLPFRHFEIDVRRFRFALLVQERVRFFGDRRPDVAEAPSRGRIVVFTPRFLRRGFA